MSLQNVVQMTKRQIETTEIFEKNLYSTEPVVINIGGSRSSKSYSILQLLLMKFISEDNKEFMIARKTLPSLRRTAYKVFLSLLEDYGYYAYCDHNKTDLTIKFKNNFIHFLSVDQIDKIKSTEFNYIFLEEANEFSLLDYRIIHTRLSGKTVPEESNKLFLALNPSDEFGWIHLTLIHESGVQIIRSSYHDNPFLSPEYIKILEDLKDTDPTLYQIYCLGEWGSIQNIIYTNYVIESSFPNHFKDQFYGLDFGYNAPTALVFIGVYDNELYLREVIYQTHLTNQDLINLLNTKGISKKIPIYADSAEPARIEEIYKAGYNIHPANKNVLDGIDAVKRYKLHLHEADDNFIKEIRSYKWKEDKNGNILDEPVKFMDHLLDGTRYGTHTHMTIPPQLTFLPTVRGGKVR